MTIRKNSNGKWLFEKYLDGGRRIRKTFATKGEAVAYENYIDEQAATKPWIAEKQDRRRLSDLVNIWYLSHGKTLQDGDREKRILDFICESLGDPLVDNFTAKDFTNYRQKRLSGEIFRVRSKQVVSKRTLNLELVYFRSVFNELKRLGEWNKPNPLDNITQFKTTEQEMAYFTSEQIDTVLAEAAKSTDKELLLKVKIGLSTGARWSEICNLTASQIKDGRITLIKTKGRRNRSVPITQDLFNEIPKTKGKLFKCTISDKYFRKVIDKCDIELPAGQLTHVLRHTFASHFMMNGGNILVLQKILGHTDIKVTMRYAHFAPDHLEEAAILNPLIKR